jgi:hypothetical protein
MRSKRSLLTLTPQPMPIGPNTCVARSMSQYGLGLLPL